MWYSTFKAVVRRDGAFANQTRTYNFGDDLLEPFMQTIDTKWASAFNTTIRNRFNSAIQQGREKIDMFSAQFGGILEARGASVRMKTIFETQVSRLVKSVTVALQNARKSVETGQKDANRLFAERIEVDMKPVYSVCAREQGKGCYARMKSAMLDHVKANKDTMFANAAESVQEELERMLSEAKTSLEKDFERLCSDFRRDCMYLISIGTRDFSMLDVKDQHAILRALTQADQGLENLGTSVTKQCTIESATASGAAAQVDIPTTGNTLTGMMNAGIGFDDIMEEEEEEEEDISDL